MHMHHLNNNVFMICSLFAIGLYLIGVVRSNKKFKKWPMTRFLCWIFGVLSITVAMIGPLQHHDDFVMHMYAHLLIGMISPLLMSLAQPITLLLRNLSVARARKVTSILKHTYFQIITHPVVAMLLNIGVLWFIYTSALFYVMHEVIIVNIIVHLHIFLGGYVFTISILSIPPLQHRTSFKMRAFVFIIFMALHSMLAKWLYANPLMEDVDAVQKGAMLMYYGGDIIDVIIIILLLREYYKPSKQIVQAKKVFN